MSPATALIALVWVGVTLYALLGGADFGGGVLHLLARGVGQERQRAAVAKTMGPVWEANHVWLIFAMTIFFSAFPRAFGVLGSALFLPATLALLGIVLRGAAFSFANALEGDRRIGKVLQRIFEAASVITPFLFGAIAGGLARQRIHVQHGVVRGGGSAFWIGPFQLVVGVMAVALCVAVAAGFMSVEMSRTSECALAESFRRRALGATALACGLAIAAFALARGQAPALYGGLTGPGLPGTLAATVALGGALGALRQRRYRLARAALGLAMTAFIWGWGFAQYPVIAGPQVTVHDAAASAPELSAILVALGGGLLLLAPAVWLLYVAFRRNPVEVT